MDGVLLAGVERTLERKEGLHCASFTLGELRSGGDPGLPSGLILLRAGGALEAGIPM